MKRFALTILYEAPDHVKANEDRVTVEAGQTGKYGAPVTVYVQPYTKD